MTTRRRYLDFDLLVESDGPDRWAVVLSSPAGEASSRFEVPFSRADLAGSMQRVPPTDRGLARSDSRRAAAAQQFGARLHEAVFSRDVGTIFQQSLDAARSQGMGLRLLVRTTDAALAALPWELLCSHALGRFQALSAETPVVRYVETVEPFRPRPADEVLRILVVVSSPSDLPPIDVGRERHLLTATLADLVSGGLAELESLEPATLPALTDALRRHRTNVVHFTGHSWFDRQRSSSVLVFEDERGRARAVDTDALGTLLRDVPSLGLVVLDTDEAVGALAHDPVPSAAEGLVRRGVPAAIGMQFDVSVSGRRAFAHELYVALAGGVPVDVSVAEARKAMYVGDSDTDWASPVLYTRVRDDAGAGGPAGASLDLDLDELLGCRTVGDIASVWLTDSHAGSDPSSVLRGRFSTITEDARAAIAQKSTVNRREALGRLADQLARLSRELGREGSTFRSESAGLYQQYAAQLAPVAMSWHAIVVAAVAALGEEVEHLQAVDSPYIVGLPLRREEPIFVGRSDISVRIERLIVRQGTPPLLLYGQRRMGKTSLLYNLGRLLPSTILPLFVDLQGPPAQANNHGGFLYHLADAMAGSARSQRAGTIPVPPRESFSADPFSQFYAWLDDLECYSEGRTVLLMLDEFEALDRAFASERLDPDEVLGMMRHLIQHRSAFKLLLAGSHTLDQFKKWSSYLINVQVLKVGYLSDQEARKLIERPVPDFALAYDQAATRRVLELTRAHPFLIQLLCAEIVALKNEQPLHERRRASPQDVDAAVPLALESGSMFFNDVERGQIDDDARTVLKIMSRGGEGMPVDEASILAHFAGDLPATLQRLRQRDLIETSDEGHRFQVELVRRWFAR